ncbi:MAG TPA: proline-rich domain-containing protein [Flexilinea sp.]|nr:proline-rich domain-containing protein [Flexilinea sp.]
MPNPNQPQSDPKHPNHNQGKPNPSGYPYPPAGNPGNWPWQPNDQISGYPPNRQYSNPQKQNSTNPSLNNNPKKKPGPKKDRMDEFGRIFTMILSAFILIYMGWLFAPRIRNSMTFWPTKTPTPVTPSPTLISSPTITPLASNTPTLSPTETPGPLSEYWIADGKSIDPAVPNSPDGVIVLHADKNAEVNPPLDDVTWTSSEKIASDLGKSTYTEKWFATYSSGWIRWFMDQPLREGLYEIYTMDTMYSSGGSLDFAVSLGDQLLTPLTGSQHVDFMTSQYDPVQSADTWRSIGIYYVGPSTEALNVTTSWQDRDEYTIVAVDRLLIVPRRVSDLGMLNSLSVSGTKYVWDDLEAEITGKDYIISQKEQLAWDDSYQLVLDPKTDVEITFPNREPYPIGNYKLYAWMPASKGGITAAVKFYLDNTVLPSDTGEESVSYTAPKADAGSWIEIGSWTTDKYYERPRKIKLSIVIPEGSKGEFPVDCFALIHNGF